MSEHQEQVTLIKWFNLQYPSLTMFSIPNAAKRSVRLASYMKSEGLLGGVSDLFLMKASNGYHGLFIEMKQAKGKVTENQQAFMVKARSEKYQAIVCYGFEQARLAIIDYLKS